MMLKMKKNSIFKNPQSKLVFLRGLIISILFTCVISIAVIMNSYTDEFNREKITRKVNEINGVVEIVEPYNLFQKSPFTWNSKSARIYKFTFSKDGVKHIGWVRFDWHITWIIDSN